VSLAVSLRDDEENVDDLEEDEEEELGGEPAASAAASVLGTTVFFLVALGVLLFEEGDGSAIALLDVLGATTLGATTALLFEALPLEEADGLVGGFAALAFLGATTLEAAAALLLNEEAVEYEEDGGDCSGGALAAEDKEGAFLRTFDFADRFSSRSIAATAIALKRSSSSHSL